MMWVAWRQHRAAVFTAWGVILAAAAIMVVTRFGIQAALADMGAADCLSKPSACDFGNAMTVLEEYGAYINLWPLVLYLLPVVLGIVAGAPLFAKELSQGSHVFSLTQSVSRKCWWATKLVVCLVPIVVGIGLLGLLSLWALGPVLELVDNDRIQPGSFEVQGPVMLGYLVLAFAVSATLGLLTRNNVVPMVITVGVYLVLALSIVSLARPSYLPAMSETQKQGKDDSTDVDLPGGAWPIGESYVTKDGKTVGDSAEYCTREGCDMSDLEYATIEYQPDTRFWAFQGIETGVYLVLAAGALAVGARRLRALP